MCVLLRGITASSGILAAIPLLSWLYLCRFGCSCQCERFCYSNRNKAFCVLSQKGWLWGAFLKMCRQACAPRRRQTGYLGPRGRDRQLLELLRPATAKLTCFAAPNCLPSSFRCVSSSLFLSRFDLERLRECAHLNLDEPAPGLRFHTLALHTNAWLPRELPGASQRAARGIAAF